jgi:transcriptional regulator with XRE-family HTH domain
MQAMENSDEIKQRRQPTFLRQWRKHRALSQEEAADRIGVKQGTLSKVERGELPYNQDFLERVALAYGCEPEDLLSVNPLKPDPLRLVVSDLRKAPADVRARAINVLEALLKAG